MLSENFNELPTEEKILSFVKLAFENLSVQEIRILSSQLDANVCDKVYKITIYDSKQTEDGRIVRAMDRQVMNIDAYELLGMLETTQLDIIQQIKGQSVLPEVVNKMVIEEKKV